MFSIDFLFCLNFILHAMTLAMSELPNSRWWKCDCALAEPLFPWSTRRGLTDHLGIGLNVLCCCTFELVGLFNPVKCSAGTGFLFFALKTTERLVIIVTIVRRVITKNHGDHDPHDSRIFLACNVMWNAGENLCLYIHEYRCPQIRMSVYISFHLPFRVRTSKPFHFQDRRKWTEGNFLYILHNIILCGVIDFTLVWTL